MRISEEELKNQFRYFVSGYLGVSLMDEYPIKEYMLKEIEEYIKVFIDNNPIYGFDFKKELNQIKEEVTDKVKLQDALLVLNKMNGPMDLVFMIKERLKKYGKH